MIDKYKNLPLRSGVGIVVLNKENKVFVAKRIDNKKNFWQMPQGGVDKGEDLYEAAIRELNEIKIYGSDWPTNDGTGIRDYIHVMDLAEGHLKTLNFLLKRKAQSLTINLGTGKGTSVLELIKTFQKVNGLKIPYRFVDRRPGDNPYVVADNSLAKSVLNWEPKRNIKDICKNGWNWQRQNPDGFVYSRKTKFDKV